MSIGMETALEKTNSRVYDTWFPRASKLNMCGNLEELSKLSKDLALSSIQPCPEEYIKQTLLAHGFFKHSTNLDSPSQVCDKDSQCMNQRVDEKGKDKTPCGISEEDKKRTTQLISLVKEGKEVHRLREPRNLYARTGHNLSPRNLPLWPLEVPCIRQDKHFVKGLPPYPERFFKSETEVVSPKIRSCNGGTVVYRNCPGPEKYFTSARAGPSPGLITPAPSSPDSTTLVFESRFESGNLAKAVQVGKWDYELYLRFDLYTNKHTQWFYFSVANMCKGQTYRFTIVNLYKAGSLYNGGMQPVMYSEAGSRESGVGWRRAGHAIKYFKTPIKRADTKQETYYYGLTWSYKFEYDQDTCYFAHCYPYTYSDLQDYIHRIVSNSKKSEYVKLRTLCHSIAGNSVPILTITSPVKSQAESKAKRAVVLTARVHPGETNGSWMMKGFLDFITGSSPDAKILRDSFVFKVIPMLNPDGVIVGNYRCSLAGRDLNRNYRSKLKDSYPTIWHTKAMVKKLTEDREIVLFCDFHGHSKKQNVFIYGCDVMDNPHTRLRARVFPKMLSKNAPAMFSYKDSKFNVHKSKESTGRVVMWREMGISNSYTMESTFCGSILGKMAGLQFSSRDLETMGYHVCDTLLDYCDPDQTKVESILHGLEEEYRQSVLDRLASLGQKLPPGVDPLDLVVDLGSDEDSSDLGSDSSESDGPPVHIMAKDARRKKKKKLKSRRERNKHKALLKLTHTSMKPPANMPAASHDAQQHTTMVTPMVHSEQMPHSSRRHSIVDMSNTPPRHSQLELARNGGIPVFVQERIEERMKRRSEVDMFKASDPDAEYVEAVTLEYMRQGVSGGFVQEATQQDPRKSLSAISQSGDCPISITSMAIYENKTPRPSSRLGKRPSLPQLATELHGPGAFASQYVANHLRDVVPTIHPSSPSMHHSTAQAEPTGVNNTRNLANLSKLFRQLRPQPLHSEARNKLMGSLRPEDKTKSNANTGLHGHPSRVEFQTFTEEQPTSSHESFNLSDKSLSGSERFIGTKPAPKIEPHTQKREKIPSKDSFRAAKQSRNNHELTRDALTTHDKKILAEARPTIGTSALEKSSPLTSSWESISSPKELSNRTEDYCPSRIPKQPQEDVDCESLKQSEFDSRIPEKKNLSEPTIRYDVLLKSLGIKQQKQPTSIPKSQSAPEQTPEIPPLKTNAHYSHQNTSHERHSNQDHLVTASSKAANTVRRAHTNKNKANSTATKANSIREHKREVADAVDKVHQKRENRKRRDKQSRDREQLTNDIVDNYPTLQEVVQGERDVPRHLFEEDYKAGGLLDETTGAMNNRCNSTPISDTFLPMSQAKMFSSKPPSRYGPKPKPENGVIPATVSLMLSKRLKSRPSTMYSSMRPRPARPLHVRYYTKTTGT